MSEKFDVTSENFVVYKPHSSTGIISNSISSYGTEIIKEKCNVMPKELNVIYLNGDSEVVSNSRTINDIITINDDSYSLLSLEDHTNFTSNQKKIKINSNGIIKKMTLIDFPVATYYLRVNNHNTMTASIINNEFVFDFSKQKKSDTLKMFISICRGREPPNFNNRDDYLNIGRVDLLEILSTIQINESKTIRLEGYFENEKNEWFYGEIDYKYYPNETYLNNMEGTTRELVFHSKYDIELSLRINDKIYGPFIKKKDEKLFNDYNILRIGFKNFENKYMFRKEKEISSENLNNSISLSEYGISFISKSEISKISQYKYILYDLNCIKKYF